MFDEGPLWIPPNIPFDDDVSVAYSAGNINGQLILL
jgi:hypothetical protein